ncbi:FAD-binding domain-containing protein [Lichenihabitans sp. Uapishka_5]|uniref:FAD-binding domain-containing protein n=1 Tax=Lichenihabitans sp. Uapishka_5 TaxID=3037302 RepID=UPI0029E7E225|nr:FAD-binding domain-containing protein [Lichenihabitans sp. Uapishka_5]MDX7951700.1 FAD-binding domain-containing protein [Lichenihabitans sp. Uapishka_5]
MTREAGLSGLDAFLAGQGPHYAALRNTDRGRDAAPTTSALSPFLRRRLITEDEVVRAAIDAFGEQDAEKFVSEVFWRTYFKGHLETHPQAWTGALAGAARAQGRLAAEPGLRRIYDQAVEGRTGIDGFDDWSRDLVETGWLHNHARMWFASIWIFTLRLPWELGADFFMRNLIDGDPASNTLSWRWVAGLHTRGKHYVARRDNIRRFTDGRYDPQGLDEDPDCLEEAQPPREAPLSRAEVPPSGTVALLLHGDDLHPETLPLGRGVVQRIAVLTAHAPDAVGRVRAADEQALEDASRRAEAHFGCSAEPLGEGWNAGLPIVTAYAPVGPSADALPAGVIRLRRAWDEAAWPVSNRGYSRVRSAIPRLLGV